MNSKIHLYDEESNNMDNKHYHSLIGKILCLNVNGPNITLVVKNKVVVWTNQKKLIGSLIFEVFSKKMLVIYPRKF